MIRKFELKDTPQIAEIYNYYVLNSIITFDRIPFSIEEYTIKIKDIFSNFPCIIFEENNEILGYAYANYWRTKPSYNQTVESTVYVKHGIHGKKIGSQLYTELLKQLRELDFHAIIGSISLPNDQSIQFHEKFGFEKVAHFKEVGKKFGKWIDVGFWQLNFKQSSI
jgi:L-amino acid N-acyltransferase YncA